MKTDNEADRWYGLIWRLLIAAVIILILLGIITIEIINAAKA